MLHKCEMGFDGQLKTQPWLSYLARKHRKTQAREQRLREDEFTQVNLFHIHFVRWLQTLFQQQHFNVNPSSRLVT